MPTPGGVWAPTIRYRDGVFYVIVTVMLGGRGCVRLHRDRPGRARGATARRSTASTGIDPDLAWDDDGTAYVTFAGFPHAIRQVRVDLATGEALEEPRAAVGGHAAASPRRARTSTTGATGGTCWSPRAAPTAATR